MRCPTERTAALTIICPQAANLSWEPLVSTLASLSPLSVSNHLLFPEPLSFTALLHRSPAPVSFTPFLLAPFFDNHLFRNIEFLSVFI